MARPREQTSDFCWGALVARVLHPVQVEIIEALRWIDEPLTAADLTYVLAGRRTGLRIERHLRRLDRIEAVVWIDPRETRSRLGERSYALAAQDTAPAQDPLA